MRFFSISSLIFIFCIIANCLDDKDKEQRSIKELWRNWDQETPLTKRLWRNWDGEDSETKEKRLWRNWDEENSEDREKRLWRNWDMQKNNQIFKRNHALPFSRENIKRLWREEDRGPICTTICPCEKDRNRRDVVSSKRVPVPCCC